MKVSLHTLLTMHGHRNLKLKQNISFSPALKRLAVDNNFQSRSFLLLIFQFESPAQKFSDDPVVSNETDSWVLISHSPH